MGKRPTTTTECKKKRQDRMERGMGGNKRADGDRRERQRQRTVDTQVKVTLLKCHAEERKREKDGYKEVAPLCSHLDIRL